jgi:polyhydroxyalkanoate synthesis repressor PhaR
MSVQKVVIKKYGNRRLYDTSSSRYINLDQVAELVRQGAEVQVVDAKTGEDLTRVTLTQIIVEDTKDQPTGLPLELLRQLIVASDQARQDFMMWYLKTAFDSYQKVQDVVQNQLSSVRSAATAPLEAMRQFFSGTQPPNPQIDELQKRIAELEAKLHSQRTPRKSAKKKSG